VTREESVNKAMRSNVARAERKRRTSGSEKGGKDSKKEKCALVKMETKWKNGCGWGKDKP